MFPESRRGTSNIEHPIQRGALEIEFPAIRCEKKGASEGEGALFFRGAKEF
jgi:hypothetical protein